MSCRHAIDRTARRACSSTAAALARLLRLQQSPADAEAFRRATPDLAAAQPRVPLRCLAISSLAHQAPLNQALREFEPLLAWARGQQAYGEQTTLLTAQAVVLARGGRLGEAAIAAAEAEALGATCAASQDPLTRALACAEVFQRGAAVERARASLRHGAALAQAQADLLPEAYRESFRQRNPTVRALLEAARRAARVARIGCTCWRRDSVSVRGRKVPARVTPRACADPLIPGVTPRHVGGPRRCSFRGPP